MRVHAGHEATNTPLERDAADLGAWPPAGKERQDHTTDGRPLVSEGCDSLDRPAGWQLAHVGARHRTHIHSTTGRPSCKFPGRAATRHDQRGGGLRKPLGICAGLGGQVPAVARGMASLEHSSENPAGIAADAIGALGVLLIHPDQDDRHAGIVAPEEQPVRRPVSTTEFATMARTFSCRPWPDRFRDGAKPSDLSGAGRQRVQLDWSCGKR